jgi:GTPase SAR1 family protein
LLFTKSVKRKICEYRKYIYCIFLCLGDKESGKTTLIAKLQGNEDPKKGSGLEYGYIDVRDEYRDGKLGTLRRGNLRY